MAVPKQRQNKSRRNRRRNGHKKPKNLALIKCPNCSTMIPPHKVCYNCGYYKGKEVINKQ